MKNLKEMLKKLREIKGRGYIRTHRTGQTGIGKTLEDLLGIKEGNICISNTTFAEIKSARKDSNSMVTLFTKSPLPPKANAQLLEKFGYVTDKSKGRKVLHTTVKANEFNSLRGQLGFKIEVTKDRLKLVNSKNEELGYWDEAILKDVFERKLHHVLHILADCRGEGAKEEFWFNETWLLSGFAFDEFMKAVSEGVICVDTRIGQNPDGSPHDHGTGFRILPSRLSICFRERQRLM